LDFLYTISIMVFGRATPTALIKNEQQNCGAVRIATVRFFSSCRTTSCKDSKSRLMSSHSRSKPWGSSRLSRSYLRTNTRKLQNTWPMVMSSSWWSVPVCHHCASLHRYFFDQWSRFHYRQIFLVSHLPDQGLFTAT